MQCISRWHCTDLFQAERQSNFSSSAVLFSNCSVLLGDQLASLTPFASENASSTNSGCVGFDNRLKIRYASRLYFSSDSSASSPPRSYSCQSDRIKTCDLCHILAPCTPPPLPPEQSRNSFRTPRKPRNLANRNLFANHPDHLMQMSRRQVGSILAGTPPASRISGFCEAVGFCCA